MSFSSIEDLRSHLGGRTDSTKDPAWVAKMLHPFPDIQTIDREKFILDHCKSKVVMDVGASGPMHEAIVEVARKVYGIDREDGPGVTGFNLDDTSIRVLPIFSGVEMIICGEVIEHLSNPGWFLERLHKQYGGIPLIITVPNAMAGISVTWAKKNVECVNGDHVAWYSPKTISVLLERAGYKTGGLFWYGGKGPTSEGLVVVTE